jgi:hypothetical protein
MRNFDLKHILPKTQPPTAADRANSSTAAAAFFILLHIKKSMEGEKFEC